MTAHTHTIPVDPSLTTDEAWKELCIFGRRVTFTGAERWAVVRCDGDECAGIERASWTAYANDRMLQDTEREQRPKTYREGGRLYIVEAFAVCCVLFFFFAVFWSAAHQ